MERKGKERRGGGGGGREREREREGGNRVQTSGATSKETDIARQAVRDIA